MIAPRRRSDPALPTTSRGRARVEQIEGAIIDVSRVAGPLVPSGEVELAEHVVQVDPGAGDDDARAGAESSAVSDAALPSASTTEMCVVPRAAVSMRPVLRADLLAPPRSLVEAAAREAAAVEVAPKPRAAHAVCARIISTSRAIASALPAGPPSPSPSSSRRP